MVNAAGNLSRAPKVIPLLVRLYSLFFLIATTFTIVSLILVSDFMTNAVHVSGQVVGSEIGAKGTRAPIVRFRTTKGEMLQLKSSFYTSPAPNVGDTVKVLYRITNPRDWCFDDFMHLYFWTFLGSVFMFAWALAITLTKLIGDHQIRKLKRDGNLLS